MSKEFVVSSTPHEIRVAIVEDDRLSEIYVERAAEHAIAGGIYKGRINRVLPGMQSAFVKIGLERDAFLYVTDIIDETEQLESGELDADDEVMPDVKSEPSRPQKAVSTEDTAEAQDSAESSDEESAGDKRRRRGRRSRRRRGRGASSLPDAKSAESEQSDEATAKKESSSDEEAEEVAVSNDKPATDVAAAPKKFSVLPGESLAKYDPMDVDSEAEDTTDVAADADDSAEELVVDEDVEEAVEEDDAAEVEEEDQEEDEFEASEEPDADGEEDSSDEEEPTDFDEDEVDEDSSDEPNEESDETDDSEGSDEDEEKAEPTEASVRDRNDGQPLRRGRRGRRRRGRGGRGREESEAPSTEESNDTVEASTEEAPKQSGRRSKSTPREEPTALISDLIKPGQEIIVQVAKEPLGKKGARITSHVALPGRFVVYMPTVAHTGISRKIGSEGERSRLRRIIKENSEGVPGGFIVRTAGQGAEEADLIADLTFLANLWKGIQEKADKRPAPALLHADLDIVERIMRDHLGQNYKTIWVDSEVEYERVVRFVERFQPELLDRVKLYTRSTPIFDKFNITQEIEKALRPKVWLKSGGYLVINQTEALVAIDVNTGKYVGKSDRLEDTIVKTNLEAADELVRQMKLRDLGGIVVVDFIDMEDRSNRKKVSQALENALRSDRAPSKVLNFNDFGLVCITRKRVKQSLEKALCSPCPSCQGAGHVPSVPTVIYNLLGDAHRMGKRENTERAVIIRCNPDVGKELKARSNSYLQELEEVLGASVLIKSDVTLARENFDID